MKRRLLELGCTAIAAAVLVLGLQGTWIAASPVTIPHTFQARTSLPAPWLNENFAALRTAINSITGDQIVDGTIGAAELAASSVTNAKIADGAVTSGKIPDLGVPTGKLAVGATVAAFSTTTPTTGLAAGTGGAVAAVLPAITTRGGRVFIGGTIGWAFTNTAGGTLLAQHATIRLQRKPAAADASSYVNIAIWDYEVSVAGAAFRVPLPTPFYVDQTTAGSYTYQFTAAVDSAAGVITTGAVNTTGQVYAIELG